MENSYGIGVTNKYSIFLDDDDGADPFEILESAAKKEKEDKKAKVTGKENKNTSKTAGSKPSSKAPAKEKPQEKDARPAVSAPSGGRGGGASRGRGGFGESRGRGGGFGAPSELREERNNRRNWDDRADFREGGAPPRFGQDAEGGAERGRGRGRGFGRGRGRGGVGRGGGTDYRGKREFDRQSGSDRSSGVKAVDKRDGSGRGNWGTVQDDLAGEMDAPAAPLDDSTGGEAEAAPAADQAAEEAAGDAAGAEEQDAEPKELTLDEWRQQQGARSQPKFNVRRAGEGENLAQWKGTFELKKKVEDSDEEESDEEEEEQVRHGRPKNFVKDIQFTFSDSRRGSRGGRRLRPAERVLHGPA